MMIFLVSRILKIRISKKVSEVLPHFSSIYLEDIYCTKALCTNVLIQSVIHLIVERSSGSVRNLSMNLP